MSPIGQDLLDLLGDTGYLVLLESHSGIRLFVPKDPDRSKLQLILDIENLRRLSDCYGGEYIKVPLDREFRAGKYRDQGDSNARIARRIGITESAVERLFSRVKRHDPRQTELFS